MSLPWFRMYAEFAGDPVVQSLAFEDQRHYVVILCLKCNGTLDRKMAPARREAIIARGLGLDMNTLAEVKRRLSEINLISKNWQPRAWDKRQFSSDVSTERVRKYRKSKGTGNVAETEGNSSGNAPDTEQIQNRTEQRKRFVPPTVEQVSEYCIERQNGIDPKAFVDHYQSANWKRGNTKIVDWKACVRTWERNNRGDRHEKSRRPSAVERVERANGIHRDSEPIDITPPGPLLGKDG